MLKVVWMWRGGKAAVQYRPCSVFSGAGWLVAVQAVGAPGGFPGACQYQRDRQSANP